MDLLMKNVNNPDMKVLKTDGNEYDVEDEGELIDKNEPVDFKIPKHYQSKV